MGSCAGLADSARFVKRMSSAVDLGGEQVRGPSAADDDLDPDSASAAKPLFLGSVVGRRFPYRCRAPGRNQYHAAGARQLPVPLGGHGAVRLRVYGDHRHTQRRIQQHLVEIAAGVGTSAPN